MPDWLDYLNPQVRAYLQAIMPASMKQQPQTTPMSRMLQSVDSIGPVRQQKPVDYRGVPFDVNARRTDIDLGGPSLRAPNYKERLAGMINNLGNQVYNQPVGRLAVDAANKYQETFGDPITNANPVSPAVGTMMPAMRKAARNISNNALKDLIISLGKEKRGAGFDSETMRDNDAARGFLNSVDSLRYSHPRLMTELYDLGIDRSSSALGYHLNGRGIRKATHLNKEDIRNANKDQTLVAQRYLQQLGYPSDEVAAHELIGSSGTAEKAGSIFVNPDMHDYVAAVEGLDSVGKYKKGMITGFHEPVHHAQDMVSNTPFRQKHSIEYMRGRFGKIFGYLFDPAEIGARATSKRKANLGTRRPRSYVNDVINEINYSMTSPNIRGSEYNIDKNDWATSVLPELSNLYGVEMIPVFTDGVFEGVKRGKRFTIAKDGSRIYDGPR